MRTYRLYQVGFVDNHLICTYVSETTAADFSTAEDLLLASMPSDVIEYLITIVK
jgi:hypothetical protein